MGKAKALTKLLKWKIKGRKMNSKDIFIIIKKGILVLSIALVFGSCKIMQTYNRPENIADEELYRGIQTPDSTNIADIPWDELFTDPILQSYINEALSNNFDLQIAVARIKKAEANFKQSKAGLFPSIGVNVGATMQKTGIDNATSTEAYELYGNASWEADIWGKLKSTKRANLASLLESQAYKRAVQTQLVADIATAYYTLLAYDEQLRITEKTLEYRVAEVETMKMLKDNDVVTGAAVVQSQASRYSAEVTIPDLQQKIYELENSICILLGRNPHTIERTSLYNQEMGIDIKVGVPVQLLANRPDVQEAEYQLRYYFEMVNHARAYFYPELSITGQAGFSGNDLSELFDASSVFRNLIGGLTQPLFNQGLNKQRMKVAQANQEEYLAAFRQTLLAAGEEVLNALHSYQAANKKIAIRSKQVEYLEKSVEYTKELLKYTSSTNYTDVLTSEQSLLSAELSGVSDKLQQLQAIVTLYRSLGGGWKDE